MPPLCAALLIVLVLALIYYVIIDRRKPRYEGMCANPADVKNKFNELKSQNNGEAPSYTSLKNKLSCVDTTEYEEAKRS
jgi:hypothetical protein